MDKGLLEFCTTDLQREIIKLKQQGLTTVKIARELSTQPRSVRRIVALVANRAAQKGYSPNHDMTHTVPDGFNVAGVSSLYGEDGNLKAQWVKSRSEKENQINLLTEKIEAGELNFPQFEPSPKPEVVNEDLCSLLTITDYHIGMYSWGEETGEDWDIQISRDLFLNAVHDMLEACPASGVGILNQLGDFLHWDGIVPVTPTSFHILDSDGRYGKLVDLTMSLMTEAIRMMLRKFGQVIVIQAEGNHDISGSIWLRKFIKHMFEKDDRVQVIDNEFPYYAYLHGEIMLGFHHGHKMKLNQLAKLFSSEPRFRGMWGQAQQTYIHTGHFHHERVIEDGGAIAEQHPTLAARDSYATRLGLVATRGAKVITYDKTDGEIHRVTVRPRLN